MLKTVTRRGCNVSLRRWYNSLCSRQFKHQPQIISPNLPVAIFRFFASVETCQISVSGYLGRMEISPAGSTITESIDGVSWRASPGTAVAKLPALTVVPGHVFVLGDNRDNSKASRKFGLVPLSGVVGRARQVWFSKADSGIRRSRIGAALTP
ncbi:hypothetical protein AB833_09760 [Chromatiales bacterium (ex Bugula neritina AB1)]|nr:hypothetical protein AB833_09760 [Chromatiales bacterium (ex Bugula neritina AB1)]